MENTRGRDLVEAGRLCERKNGRGVDTNRNWAVDWGVKEKDYDPAEEYPGRAPHSEPEVQVVLGEAKALAPHVWLNVHSGMLALFMPYDHKATVRARGGGRLERAGDLGGLGAVSLRALPCVAHMRAVVFVPLGCCAALASGFASDACSRRHPQTHAPQIPDGAEAAATLRMLGRVNELSCGGKCAVGSGGKSVGYLAHGTATDFMYERLKVGGEGREREWAAALVFVKKCMRKRHHSTHQHTQYTHTH